MRAREADAVATQAHTGSAALALAAHLLVAPAGAQDFQVNSDPGLHYDADVAIADDGSFVVAWSAALVAGGEQNSHVRARAYDASGDPFAGDFVLRAFPPRFPRRAAVAKQPNGDFVAAWNVFEVDGELGLFGQRYDADGTALGPELRIDSSPASSNMLDVAASADGDFVVVWDDQPASSQILGQRFAANGLPLGVEFAANTDAGGLQDDPSVAVDADGDFVAVWQTNDAFDLDVRGQLFAANGTPVGSEFPVNSYTTGLQGVPAVAMAAAGDFVVVWAGRTSGGGYGIAGQRFSAGGVPQGGELQISEDFGVYPSVAMDDDGNFIVAWGGFATLDDIGGRRFARTGAPVGEAFRVNSYTTGRQERPSVAADGAGRFVVVWHGDGRQSIQRSPAGSIGVVFADGFESGDVLEWSGAQP